jgi:hypothetical protein
MMSKISVGSNPGGATTDTDIRWWWPSERDTPGQTMPILRRPFAGELGSQIYQGDSAAERYFCRSGIEVKLIEQS